MKLGKMDRLNIIVDDLISSSKGTISSCVVTNERGLIVAGKTNDGSSNETLAAMISLLSEVAARVNSNLGHGHPKSASVKGFGELFQIQEFLVKSKQFRIGTVSTEQERSRFYFLKKRIDEKQIAHYLGVAAKSIRRVLEDA
ncbi:MAG: hypothetical protein ACXACG_00330 [Candidatus Thorarchaeota archaeon]|jgi:predicted regulator of Ras-like GTPase activity (Roadblock/LC7/MglB family)